MNARFEYLLRLGDDALILGQHRASFMEDLHKTQQLMAAPRAPLVKKTDCVASGYAVRCPLDD